MSYQVLAKLPTIRDASTALLIYDRILTRQPALKKWIQKFPCHYAVQSGETLKDIDNFPQHLKKILKLQQKHQVSFSKVYVLGGGSVGDFGGFVASILRRGLPCTQIPSTWLAALDSAHGGKTALNVAGFKNQVGTFHYPEKVWVIKEVLETQPADRLQEAAGEFLKTALIGGKNLLEKLSHWDWVQGKIKWSDLKSFIEVKYSVLKKDPFEKKGLRHVLNLGHTIGHAWEAEYGLPHGLAIFYGLLFDMAWSSQKNLLSAQGAQRITSREPWESIFNLKIDRMLFSLSEKKLSQYLLQDKKNSKKGIQYIFIQKPGKVTIQTTPIQDVLAEYRRQKRILEDFHENL